MTEIPEPPSGIGPKPIEGPPPPEDNPTEKRSKKFLTMHMTENEYQKFLSNYVKMMITEIKRGEKGMIRGMKKIANPDEP